MLYVLGAKHGFAQSMDCAAQSIDPCFTQTIHGSHSVYSRSVGGRFRLRDILHMNVCFVTVKNQVS